MATDPGFDPRLKAAMEEIKEVCRRYDVALAAMLVSPSHSEYVYEFPTWSPLGFEDVDDPDDEGKVGLRFRAVGSQFAGRASHHAILEAGVHLVENLRLFGAQTFEIYNHVMDMLEERVQIERQPRRHRPPQPSDAEAAERYRQPRGRGYWERP